MLFPCRNWLIALVWIQSFCLWPGILIFHTEINLLILLFHKSLCHTFVYLELLLYEYCALRQQKINFFSIIPIPLTLFSSSVCFAPFFSFFFFNSLFSNVLFLTLFFFFFFFFFKFSNLPILHFSSLLSSLLSPLQSFPQHFYSICHAVAWNLKLRRIILYSGWRFLCGTFLMFLQVFWCQINLANICPFVLVFCHSYLRFLCWIVLVLGNICMVKALLCIYIMVFQTFYLMLPSCNKT